LAKAQLRKLLTRDGEKRVDWRVYKGVHEISKCDSMG
jgi:hypothetical protein